MIRNPAASAAGVHLKMQFHRELNRARPANLVKRIEARIKAEALIEHLGRPPELRVFNIRNGLCEVRMVENIERFQSKLQIQWLR